MAVVAPVRGSVVVGAHHTAGTGVGVGRIVGWRRCLLVGNNGWISIAICSILGDLGLRLLLLLLYFDLVFLFWWALLLR